MLVAMVNPPVRIRPATPADEPAIRACVDDAYRLYLDRMATPPAPMLDDYGQLIARQVVHVAVDGDDLLGLIILWPEADHLYVDNIAVAPTAQGRGVAKQLLDHADEQARAHGRPEIRLYTNEAMTENIDYYPRRGFVETHRATDAGYHRVYFTRPVPGT